MGTLVFLTWYYPIGLDSNAGWTGATAERGALTWLFIQQFMLFMTSIASVCIALSDSAEMAAEFANLLLIMCLLFCG